MGMQKAQKAQQALDEDVERGLRIGWRAVRTQGGGEVPAATSDRILGPYRPRSRTDSR